MHGALDFIKDHRDIPVLVAFDSATGIRPADDQPGQWLAMVSSFLDSGLDCLSPVSAIVMVNQVRMKRSVVPGKFFVDGTVSSTARKVVDQFSTRLELRRGEEKPYGYTMLVDIVANIASKPSTMLELPVRIGMGVDTMRDLLTYSVEIGVTTQEFSWLTVGDEYRLGPGMNAAVTQIEEAPEIARYLLDRVMTRA